MCYYNDDKEFNDSSTSFYSSECNLRKKIEEKGIPCFEFPNNAAKAIKALTSFFS